MNHLILVRHSTPVIQPNVSPPQWKLSSEGIEFSHYLAKQIAPLEPDLVISSPEEKAVQTGAILADDLGIPHFTEREIREHESGTGRFLSPLEFKAAVREFFEYPEQEIFGIESASDARKRFVLALGRIIRKFQESNIVLVTHGRILSLFVSEITNLDPYEFWQTLEMPAYVVLSIPGLEMVQIVNKIKLQP